MASLRIAVDAMSGDLGLRSAVPAAVSALHHNPRLHIELIGDQPALTAALNGKRYDAARLTLHHSESVVAMDDKPSVALRKKRNSSMAIGLERLRDKHVSGLVSAGNTGALVAMSCIIVERIPGIQRPALCAPIPSAAGHTFLLDLGANIDGDADELYQFAVMGCALARILDNNVAPRVAILNIGEEMLKGRDSLREAAGLISANKSLNYVGFVEGGDILGDAADVIVCEGFVGNVALKVCEGTATFIANNLKREFSSSAYGRLVGLAVGPLLRSFQKGVDPRRHNGAALLGLQGVVVKSHGGSDAGGFERAIHQAVAACELCLPDRIADQVKFMAAR